MSYIRQKIDVNEIKDLALSSALRNAFLPYGEFLRRRSMRHLTMRKVGRAMWKGPRPIAAVLARGAA
jgi:hypothetical protein